MSKPTESGAASTHPKEQALKRKYNDDSLQDGQNEDTAMSTALEQRIATALTSAGRGIRDALVRQLRRAQGHRRWAGSGAERISSLCSEVRRSI